MCQLEVTQFTNGMSMEKSWKTIVHTDDVTELGMYRRYVMCAGESQWWRRHHQGMGLKNESCRSHHQEKYHMRNCPQAEIVLLYTRRLSQCNQSEMLTVVTIYIFFFTVRRFYQGDSSRWCTAGVVCEFEFPSCHCKYAVHFPHYHLRNLTYIKIIDTTQGMPQRRSLSLMQLLILLLW